MIPPHFFYQIFLFLNDCPPPKCGELSQYSHSVHIEVEDLSSRCMNGSDVGTTQDNFILPAPPEGGLPVSQDWLDRMKLVRNRTVPITLPSGKNTLADTVFKISIGHTNLGTRQL